MVQKGRPAKHSPRWLARKLHDNLQDAYPKMSTQALTLVAMVVFRTMKPYFTAGSRFFEETVSRFEEIGDIKGSPGRGIQR